MKNFLPLRAGCVLIVVALATTAQAARVISDILPPLRRQITVDIAERLAQRKAPGPVAVDLASPFNPAGFDKTEAPETTTAAASGKATAGTTPPPAGARPGTTASTGPVAPPKPTGDRDTLETLAAQIAPSGMFKLGGKPLLVIGGRRFEVGTRFTAAYNGQEYELELAAIENTTFTLRYRGEEITRPIRPVK